MVFSLQYHSRESQKTPPKILKKSEKKKFLARTASFPTLALFNSFKDKPGGKYYVTPIWRYLDIFANNLSSWWFYL